MEDTSKKKSSFIEKNFSIPILVYLDIVSEKERAVLDNLFW